MPTTPLHAGFVPAHSQHLHAAALTTGAVFLHASGGSCIAGANSSREGCCCRHSRNPSSSKHTETLTALREWIQCRFNSVVIFSKTVVHLTAKDPSPSILQEKAPKSIDCNFTGEGEEDPILLKVEAERRIPMTF